MFASIKFTRNPPYNTQLLYSSANCCRFSFLNKNPTRLLSPIPTILTSVEAFTGVLKVTRDLKRPIITVAARSIPPQATAYMSPAYIYVYIYRIGLLPRQSQDVGHVNCRREIEARNCYEHDKCPVNGYTYLIKVW